MYEGLRASNILIPISSRQAMLKFDKYMYFKMSSGLSVINDTGDCLVKGNGSSTEDLLLTYISKDDTINIIGT